MRSIQTNESAGRSTTRDSHSVRTTLSGKRRRATRKQRTLRILIVDDSMDSADSVAALLRMLGHTVRVVYSSQNAVEAAAEFKPSLVLLDIAMPIMNGHEVARRLRQQLQLKTTRLIAISGFGSASDRQKSQDVGFDHHLVKPFSPEELLELVARPKARSGSG